MSVRRLSQPDRARPADGAASKLGKDTAVTEPADEVDAHAQTIPR